MIPQYSRGAGEEREQGGKVKISPLLLRLTEPQHYANVRIIRNVDAWQHSIELFNNGEFWECHEALEPLWMAATGVDKEFYAGVILLAAALHKARKMGSARGGRRNYAKALAHLALVPDTFHGVDVRELEATVHDALRHPYKQPKIKLLDLEHDGRQT